MGAHSLGGAKVEYKGDFTGTKTRNHFDERYYSQMIDSKFEWTNKVRLLKQLRWSLSKPILNM